MTTMSVPFNPRDYSELFEMPGTYSASMNGGTKTDKSNWLMLIGIALLTLFAAACVAVAVYFGLVYGALGKSHTNPTTSSPISNSTILVTTTLINDTNATSSTIHMTTRPMSGITTRLTVPVTTRKTTPSNTASTTTATNADCNSGIGCLNGGVCQSNHACKCGSYSSGLYCEYSIVPVIKNKTSMELPDNTHGILTTYLIFGNGKFVLDNVNIIVPNTTCPHSLYIYTHKVNGTLVYGGCHSTNLQIAEPELWLTYQTNSLAIHKAFTIYFNKL